RVTEARSCARTSHPPAEPVAGKPWSHHLFRHRHRQDGIRLAIEGSLHFDSKSREIGRGRPQSAGRRLWEKWPSAWKRFTIDVMAGRGSRVVFRRKRLTERARRHAELAENEVLHQIGERLSGHVNQQLLNHAISAA